MTHALLVVYPGRDLPGRQVQSDSRLAFGSLLAFGTLAVWIARL